MEARAVGIYQSSWKLQLLSQAFLFLGMFLGVCVQPEMSLKKAFQWCVLSIQVIRRMSAYLLNLGCLCFSIFLGQRNPSGLCRWAGTDSATGAEKLICVPPVQLGCVRSGFDLSPLWLTVQHPRSPYALSEKKIALSCLGFVSTRCRNSSRRCVFFPGLWCREKSSDGKCHNTSSDTKLWQVALLFFMRNRGRNERGDSSASSG